METGILRETVLQIGYGATSRTEPLRYALLIADAELALPRQTQYPREVGKKDIEDVTSLSFVPKYCLEINPFPRAFTYAAVHTKRLREAIA